MAFDPDTGIGGAAARFPDTRHSAILAARGESEAERSQAYDAIVRAYWKPAYKYIRVKWRKPNEDAKDLTQAFFARAMERSFFKSYDAGKGTFRAFLRTCIDGFVANEEVAARRLKRGGGAAILSLDFETAEGELATLDTPDSLTTDEYFYREWVRSLFSLALERLRERCAESGKQLHFRLFERYDLEGNDVSYNDLAAEFGIPTTKVTNYLAYVRREFRRLALEHLRELTGSESEFRSEARSLFGPNWQ